MNEKIKHLKELCTDEEKLKLDLTKNISKPLLYKQTNSK